MKDTKDTIIEMCYIASAIAAPKDHPEIVGRYEPELSNLTDYIKMQANTIARSGHYHAAGVLLMAAQIWTVNRVFAHDSVQGAANQLENHG